MTKQTRQILASFLENDARPVYGLELIGRTGLPGGTLYPMLARLEHMGWLDSDSEASDPRELRRPRRRYYRLTPIGSDAARAATVTDFDQSLQIQANRTNTASTAGRQYRPMGVDIGVLDSSRHATRSTDVDRASRNVDLLEGGGSPWR